MHVDSATGCGQLRPADLFIGPSERSLFLSAHSLEKRTSTPDLVSNNNNVISTAIMANLIKSLHRKGESAADELALDASSGIILAGRSIPEHREKDIVSIVCASNNVVCILILCHRKWRSC